MEDDISTARAPRDANKKLRVTLTSGKVICYRSATITFLETLRTLDIEDLKAIDLQHRHLPLISNEVYENFKDSMKQIVRGWYVNTAGDTTEKFLQLSAINAKLNLGYKIEMGTDFETDKSKGFIKRKATDNLLVKFPDGTFIGEESPLQTYISTIEHFDISALRRKNIPVASKELITLQQKAKTQVQLSNGNWLTVPPSTKDKVKILKIIGIMMGVKLEVNTI